MDHYTATSRTLREPLNHMVFGREENEGGTVVLVGAGGIGARVMPNLIKLVPRTWTIAVVDPDRVSLNNLNRQHFATEDVSQAKAVVLADRYGRQHEVRPFVSTVQEAWPGLANLNLHLVIGCVDNGEARATLRQCCRNSCSYIDCGNDELAGQVVLDGWWRCSSGMQLNGLGAFPNLTTPSVEDTGCDQDTQTVPANNLAAAYAILYTHRFFKGGRLNNLGMMFNPSGAWQLPGEVSAGPPTARVPEAWNPTIAPMWRMDMGLGMKIRKQAPPDPEVERLAALLNDEAPVAEAEAQARLDEEGA